MVLIGVIKEYKNGRYDGMDGIEILNSFGVNCRHISTSTTEEKEKKIKRKTKKKDKVD